MCFRLVHWSRLEQILRISVGADPCRFEWIGFGRNKPELTGLYSVWSTSARECCKATLLHGFCAVQCSMSLHMWLKMTGLMCKVCVCTPATDSVDFANLGVRFTNKCVCGGQSSKHHTGRHGELRIRTLNETCLLLCDQTLYEHTDSDGIPRLGMYVKCCVSESRAWPLILVAQSCIWTGMSMQHVGKKTKKKKRSHGTEGCCH